MRVKKFGASFQNILSSHRLMKLQHKMFDCDSFAIAYKAFSIHFLRWSFDVDVSAVLIFCM